MIITDYMTIEEIIDCLIDKYGDEFNWRMIPFSNRYFVTELKRELRQGDPFLSNDIYAVAKCDSNDEVLYLGGDSTGTKEIWRIYHLTYSANNVNGYPLFKEFNSRKTAAEYMQNQFVSEYL